jgi:hypothetical protein
MAHFQLIDDPLFLKNSWLFSKGTRLFVKGDAGQEKIVIHQNNQITLEQKGTIDPAGKVLPEVFSTVPDVVQVVKTTRFEKLQTQNVTIKAVGVGKAELKGKDAAGGIAADLKPLTVVAGVFENYEGMEIDLLADVCRGSDPAKIHAVHRLLNNSFDNIFNENWQPNIDKWGERACGTVSKVGGAVLWGGNAEPDNFDTYHIPLAAGAEVKSRNQVKYNQRGVLRATTAIAGWLRKNKRPVVVGVLYGPSKLPPGTRGPKLTANRYGQLERTGAYGHSVLIVGCNKAGNLFLYVDPWNGGSQLKYKGGIAGVAEGRFSEKCDDLGVFIADPWDMRGPPVLRTSSETTGTFSPTDDSFLEVISGP